MGKSRYEHQRANANGIDVQGQVKLSAKWMLSMDAEYKNGTNFNEYASSKTADKKLKDYRMEGVYLTPSIRYDIGLPYVRSLEFSTRYEYFEQLTQGGNPRTTITPILRDLTC